MIYNFLVFIADKIYLLYVVARNVLFIDIDELTYTGGIEMKREVSVLIYGPDNYVSVLHDGNDVELADFAMGPDNLADLRHMFEAHILHSVNQITIVLLVPKLGAPLQALRF